MTGGLLLSGMLQQQSMGVTNFLQTDIDDRLGNQREVSLSVDMKMSVGVFCFVTAIKKKAPEFVMSIYNVVIQFC